MSVAAELLAATVKAGDSRRVAAAVVSALWHLAKAPATSCATLVDRHPEQQVDSCRAAIRPSLDAQVAAAQIDGVECHTAGGLVRCDVLVRTNAGHHHAFAADFYKLTAADCRRVQQKCSKAR